MKYVTFIATTAWYAGVGVFIWWLFSHYVTCLSYNGFPGCFLHDFR